MITYPICSGQAFEARNSWNHCWSQIETERMILELVKMSWQRKKLGTYKGKFGALTHFFGYQARCGYPTEFDSSYGTCLGLVASTLIRARRNGYVCCMENLHCNDVEQWKPTAVPLLKLVSINRNTNRAEYEPVVVDLKRKPFQCFRKLTAVEKRDFYVGAAQIHPNATNGANLVRSALILEHKNSPCEDFSALICVSRYMRNVRNVCILFHIHI